MADPLDDTVAPFSSCFCFRLFSFPPSLFSHSSSSIPPPPTPAATQSSTNHSYIGCFLVVSMTPHLPASVILQVLLMMQNGKTLPPSGHYWGCSRIRMWKSGQEVCFIAEMCCCEHTLFALVHSEVDFKSWWRWGHCSVSPCISCLELVSIVNSQQSSWCCTVAPGNWWRTWMSRVQTRAITVDRFVLDWLDLSEWRPE